MSDQTFATRVAFAGFFLDALLVCSNANAQFVQQGAKLVGTGEMGIAEQGASIALSADGNTAIG